MLHFFTDDSCQALTTITHISWCGTQIICVGYCGVPQCIFVIIILNYSLKSEQAINKSIIFALHIKEFQL